MTDQFRDWRADDQERMDDRPRRYGGTPQMKRITELPECQRCAKNARLDTGGDQ